MTDQELEDILGLLADLPGGGEWWPEQSNDDLDETWRWEVRYKIISNLYHRVASGIKEDEAHFIAKSPTIIRQLLSEVQYLRGQLADLCEDSRAVAEVSKLQKMIRDIRNQCNVYLQQLEEFEDAFPSTVAAIKTLCGMTNMGGYK